MTDPTGWEGFADLTPEQAEFLNRQDCLFEFQKRLVREMAESAGVPRPLLLNARASYTAGPSAWATLWAARQLGKTATRTALKGLAAVREFERLGPVSGRDLKG